ncbi:MAG: hypothetical protein H7A09_06035 [Oceanospirillaceae bacterium]|nr:hypothetical protein [Oceanospirillaceae bacterium]MCP5351339.1 hypothetical protein [Oceanospirillaceae bacterium]
MRVGTIRTIINTAFLHESKTQCLNRHLLKQLTSLPSFIRLAPEEGITTLNGFIREYIAQVPDFLEALKNAAEKAGIENHVFPFLKIAEEYFTLPPNLPSEHIGLMALMDEAYLAHRLFEEVNDRYISRVGMPLIPLDMTLANVIVHQLIGEHLANQLDEAVHQAVEQLMPREQAYESDDFHQFVQDTRGNTQPIFQEWPCLSKKMGIEFAFAG